MTTRARHTRRRTTRSRARGDFAAALLCLSLLGGCGAPQAGGLAAPKAAVAQAQADGAATQKKATAAETALDRLTAAAKRETDAPVSGEPRLGLALPQPLIDASVKLQPHAGEALARASMPLEQVLAQVTLPDYLKPGDAEARGDAEPSPAAVRAYVRGRAAYLENNRFEAVNQLEQARRLDPNSAHILRLLGIVYFDRGDDVRGAQRLMDAVKLEPDDAASLFLLGRYAYQKGRWAEAIATLARAGNDDADSVDPAIPYLRPYYLGQALLQDGYDAAAVAKLQEYLRLPAGFSRTSRLHLELAFLDRQRGQTHVQLGDALARLGRFADAIGHYHEAAADEDVDDELLAARLIYANLALNRPAQAQLLLVRALGEAQSSPRLLTLAPYVAQTTGDKQFPQVLRQVYRQNDRPPLLALAIAESLDREAAAKFLAEHLAESPADLLVFDRLVSQYAADDHAAVLATLLKLIAQEPAMARQYTDQWLSHKPPVDQMLKELAALPEADRQSAAGLFLRGALHEAAGQINEAVAAYDQAMTADAGFLSPHLATVELQLRLKRYDKALELLDKVANKDEAPARFARARALAGLNRLDEASTLIDQLLVEDARDVEYRLFKARVQTLQRDFEGAERTLNAILDFDPANELAYTALFKLYEDVPRTDHMQWLRLMRRVQREIPGSRIARVKLAEWQDANRQFPQAEQNLRGVLADHPDDDEALQMLASVLGRADRWVDAEKVLIEQVEKRPDAAVPILLLEEVSQRLDHMAQFLPRKEAFLRRQPESLARWVELARVYDQMDQPAKAIDALQEVLKLRPEVKAELRTTLARLYHRAEQTDKALAVLDEAIADGAEKPADLHYLKALMFHEQQKPEAAEDALLAALKADPNYPPANNDLGYLWADQNRNLDKAREMTLKAVTADPNNGAYLDSLGWVHYKLGQFQDAVRRLEEARSKPQGDDPVILDHLGDALWRADRKNQAINYWREALRLAEAMTGEERPDIKKVRQTLTEKIEAAEQDEAPAVAPIPSELLPANIKAEATPK